GRSRQGPSSPKAGMRCMIARGLTSWMTSHVRPTPSRTRGVKLSTTASDTATSRLTSSTPRGSAMLMVMPRLLLFTARKWLLYSHHASTLLARIPPAMRMPSGRVTASTWMTSAPSVASTELLVGENGGAIADLRHRDPQCHRLLHDLVGRVLRGPRGDDLAPFLEPRHAAVHPRQSLVTQKIRALDEHEKVVELLARI